MKVHSLQQLIDYQQVQSRGSSGEVRSMLPLSKAEESMIQEKFPRTEMKQFHTYMRSGIQKMESRAAKGTQVDYKI